MTGITVLKENVPHGPFTRSEIAEKLSSGEITTESLAFVEGLSQWTPLRDVLAKVDSAPSAHLPLGTGFGMEQTTTASIAATAPVGAGYSYAKTMAPPDHLIYAGFWLRVAAYVLDTLLMCAVVFVLSFGVGLVSGLVVGGADQGALQSVVLIAQFITLMLIVVLCWLYFALMESSTRQATLGKLALGLSVTDRQGQRISFGRATGRFFGKVISGLTFYIGFMMAGWTQRKQALHDIIADTLVVRK